MKTSQPLRAMSKLALALACAASLAGCAMNGMSPRQERNTALGAGIGALGGALISGGDAWTTIGGAVAGGVIGNVTTDNRGHYYRRDRY
ncbi:glycine zipper 2TM domain-containing protein [Pandoraea sp.]|uniref:glycine zipper 2TM domain-containing protein n=1 Tax=Pandoraea sp. TaxID=1883445 RepID=UPI0012115D12|nr:glycine zipper 2TM domain-containing protein [Pandoraea sp.]MBU6493557.1 hypothetical protein [Burkholderiales bacterium]MDE2288201.1 hypothetical protein [Burkholderiales bacterium]MDE2611228.1 hypothetical protein [Burkholderiales bacterium]TAL56222.1 MAG: hypothetical protein EPN80_04205 [Pandoraea sp.]TAM19176.1 MAG: hypothetical protein EPN65_04250 [Pandoraea sp.]